MVYETVCSLRVASSELQALRQPKLMVDLGSFGWPVVEKSAFNWSVLAAFKPNIGSV